VSDYFRAYTAVGIIDVTTPVALIELASSRVTRFNDTSCWLEVTEPPPSWHDYFFSSLMEENGTKEHKDDY
jgi:hypothetical protein